jgi:hypothetical protein
MPKAEYDKFWLNVQCTVDKDVVRTDRSHPYFAGNDNPNVEIMRYTLVTLTNLSLIFSLYVNFSRKH